jgi:hypothetical protein
MVKNRSDHLDGALFLAIRPLNIFLILLIFLLRRKLLDQIAKPSDFGLELGLLTLVVIHFQNFASFRYQVNPSLVFPIDGQRSQILEMELDNVVSHPCNYFQIIDGDGLLHVD